MATQLEIIEAKDQLAQLVVRAKSGEEIVLADAGKPVVRLTPVEDNPRQRASGLFKDQIWMSDDFQAPLTDEELKDWGL